MYPLIRGTIACIAIPPTALQMPIITQFDVCRNNAASRDSVTRGHECEPKRSHGKKKSGVKGFLTDRDFFDTISLRASLRIRALSCYPLSPTKLC